MGMHWHGAETDGQHVRSDATDLSNLPVVDSTAAKHVDPRKSVRRRPVILNGITVSVSHQVIAQTSMTPTVVEETRLAPQSTNTWAVVVWDDPVNLMSYVTHVFMKHFGFTRCKAEQLMMLVHMEGRAVVDSGGRESMERHVVAMHGYGLLATLEQAD